MKDFNDFNKGDVPGGQTAGGEQTGQKNNRNTADIAGQFSALASEYEGKNADEIMKAILKEAEKGRKNGTLTDADIDNFSAMLAPMLTAEQNKMLGKIVKKIKK